jgi:hypothetical protein
VDPKITKLARISDGGFIPMKIIETHAEFMKKGGHSARDKMCQRRMPIKIAPSQQGGNMIIGTYGKLANEGGIDVNNGQRVLSFKPAKSADIHIEHVDVHGANPVNKNGSITFKYQGGITHKFVFVGNNGLRFRKEDGSFGPNLGVGDVSKTVLDGMGLKWTTYKIECLRTAGRNTWHFKPLSLDRGLIGIELSDNADWGGLRGLYINVQLMGGGSKPATSDGMSASDSRAVFKIRRGWPNGTKWNLRGATGNDRLRCNDNCKSLGYNYFTHNPPPIGDGGCGCFKANVALSQLSMTDHANAKTQSVF